MKTPCKLLNISEMYHISCGPPRASERTSVIHVTPITITSFIQTRPRAALKIGEIVSTKLKIFYSIRYLSVVDLTNSLFHRPQVSSFAVSMNKIRLMVRRRPMGPLKNGSFSLSPATNNILYNLIENLWGDTKLKYFPRTSIKYFRDILPWIIQVCIKNFEALSGSFIAYQLTSKPAFVFPKSRFYEIIVWKWVQNDTNAGYHKWNAPSVKFVQPQSTSFLAFFDALRAEISEKWQ